MSQPSISIVGAGLSGLVLGRCLLQRGIRSVIFDRDTASTGSNRHNYGITLSPKAFRSLLRSLDIDEAAFKALAVDAAVGGVGRVERRSARDFQQPKDMRVNRRNLEAVLREGLDVQWDHNLTALHTEGGTNVLDFSNGRHSQANFVIGADGVHSSVRKAKSAGTRLNVLPYVAYYGRRRVSVQDLNDNYAACLNGTNVIEHREGQTLLRIAVDDMKDNEVNISYTYSRPAHHDDPLFAPNRPTTGAKTIPDELFSEVSGLSSIYGAFKQVFDATRMRKDRLLNWLMRSVTVDDSDLKAIAQDGTLLVGDAAHATPILGGSGANDALTDSVELAERIAEHGFDSLATWYESRSSRWRGLVRASEAVLADMHAEVKASL